MKTKVFSLLVSIIMCLTLFSGCGESTVGEAQTEGTTAATTVPEGLTAEETAVWESMPEIVTMRVYEHLESNIAEVLYIDKNGIMKSLTTDSKTFFEDYDVSSDIEWAKEKLSEYTKAEVTGEVDIHKLIDFYNILSAIDKESEIKSRQSWPEWSVSVEETDIITPYSIYGVRNKNIEGEIEIILISRGNISSEYVRDDPYGDEAFKKYIELDPFKVINDTEMTY